VVNTANRLGSPNSTRISQPQKEGKFTIKQRKSLQHECTLHLEKYFKGIIGKGSNYTSVIIWNNMVILRGEGFLTDPEKFVAIDEEGSNLVKETRMQIAKKLSKDTVPYFEEKLGANCIWQSFDVDAKNDFWVHIMFFDQLLIEVK
jgi:uncharacterized protein YbcI